MDVGKVWDKVRNDDDADYASAGPDFKGKLAHAASEAQAGRSTGIAGLEKFEQAVAKKEGTTLSANDVDAGAVSDAQARVSDGVDSKPSGTEGRAKATPKGTGAQDTKALRDAAAAGARPEMSEHSPSAPSAARPLAAESAANTTAKKSSRRSKASKKSSKKAAKKASK